jgi:hypothetical protein
MGLLRHETTGRTVALGTRSLVGRAMGCSIRATDVRVSAEHAVISWSGSAWTVRDLGSRNRTTVGDQGLEAGQEVRIVTGARLRFGGDPWTLDDDAAPAPVAVAVDDGTLIVASGSVLLLPDAQDPRVAIVPEADGTWRRDDDSGQRPVTDGEVIDVAGRAFRLLLPTAPAPTIQEGRPPALRFRVSPDEEQVDVAIIGGGRTTHLRRRAHQYLLLVLARERLRHRDQPDRGWLDREQLARALRVDPITINVQLHRIRHDLGLHGQDGAALLEVRAGTRHVRLGTDDIEIEIRS